MTWMTPWHLQAELRDLVPGVTVARTGLEPGTGQVVLKLIGEVACEVRWNREGGLRCDHGALPAGTSAQQGVRVQQWCAAAAEHLHKRSARWPAQAEAPHREPLTPDEASRRLGAEWPLLAGWADFAGRTAGEPLRWQWQPEGELVLMGLPKPPPHLRSTYQYLLRISDAFGGAERVPPWASALGFGADQEGTLTVVPTPEGFVRAVRRQLGRDPAFIPALVPMSWMLAWERPWLQHMCEGRSVINMPPPSFYRRSAWALSPRLTLRSKGLRRGWHGLLVVPGHDLTLHCLMQHRIPHSDVAEVGSAVQAALVAAPGPWAPKPLCSFYEDDLSRHCRAIWRTCAIPEDFDLAWPEALPALRAALDLRLDDARRAGWQGGWLPGEGLHRSRVAAHLRAEGN